jgi:hypothetical protein
VDVSELDDKTGKNVDFRIEEMPRGFRVERAALKPEDFMIRCTECSNIFRFAHKSYYAPGGEPRRKWAGEIAVLKGYPKNTNKGADPTIKRLWPWVVLLVVIFCAIYSYERVSEFLTVNADNLPILFFDFVLEYFLGEAPHEGVTEI